MQKRYIAPVIMLTAGAIASILNIIREAEFYDSMKSLFLVLIVFFIIGKIVTIIITKVTKEEVHTEEPAGENILTEEGQIPEDLQDTDK